MNKIFFDIGANEGNDFINIAKNEPQTNVYAFEPIPKLVEKLRHLTSHLKNVNIIESAVSDFNGKSIINISPESIYGDYSCSSLLEFSEKSKTEWPGREDFKIIDNLEVNVLRLDSFLIQNGITKIDYLKIDTQGHDLKVLKGLGDFISIVECGIMEAGAKDDILYNGQNTENESIAFLESNGFEIINVSSNDIFRNEVNIIFKNKNPKIVKFKTIYKIL